jgi:hypothetical protein
VNRHCDNPNQLKFVFVTTNPFGDRIVLETANWTRHLEKHKDMRDRQNDVQKAAEWPEHIRESTLAEDALVYEATPENGTRLLRVVVYHDDPTKALTGGTECRVGTAFFRDVAKYPQPNVGKIVWSRPAGRASKLGSGGQ